VRVLLDTPLLLWAAAEPDRLPAAARRLIEDPAVTPLASAASLWEVAIKAALGRPDFTVDARLLHRGLREAGYGDLPVTAAHAAAVADLPLLHRDPFDRLLVAQARCEGVILVTADPFVAQYPGPVQRV
jgi:PIN domain nuclease of toxin-antitoxin system